MQFCTKTSATAEIYFSTNFIELWAKICLLWARRKGKKDRILNKIPLRERKPMMMNSSWVTGSDLILFGFPELKLRKSIKAPKTALIQTQTILYVLLYEWMNAVSGHCLLKRIYFAAVCQYCMPVQWVQRSPLFQLAKPLNACTKLL